MADDLMAYYLTDRSGSMASMWQDTVGGLQHFVTEQAGIGNTWITLGFFDSNHRTYRPRHWHGSWNTHSHITLGTGGTLDLLEPNVLWRAEDIRVDSVLKQHGIRPRGGTPLLDAIWHGVHNMERELRNRPWFQGKVLFAIQTDGEENMSVEHPYPGDVRTLLEQKQGEGWQVDFIGANIDAVGTAASLGINLQNVAQYDHTNVRETYAGSSLRTANFRGA